MKTIQIKIKGAEGTGKTIIAKAIATLLIEQGIGVAVTEDKRRQVFSRGNKEWVKQLEILKGRVGQVEVVCKNTGDKQP